MLFFQGRHIKEPSNGAITIINVLAGVVIGAALIWFLIVPARNKGLTQDYKKSLQEYSEQLSSGNVELNSMQKKNLKRLRRRRMHLSSSLALLMEQREATSFWYQ